MLISSMMSSRVRLNRCLQIGRGNTTIQHVKMNRELLLKARKKIRNTVYELMRGIAHAQDEETAKRFRDLLNSMLSVDIDNGFKAEYSMFIKTLITFF